MGLIFQEDAKQNKEKKKKEGDRQDHYPPNLDNVQNKWTLGLAASGQQRYRNNFFFFFFFFGKYHHRWLGLPASSSSERLLSISVPEPHTYAKKKG